MGCDEQRVIALALSALGSQPAGGTANRIPELCCEVTKFVDRCMGRWISLFEIGLY